LVFGATVSNALPPQASTEDVKSCKAISNDQQRLKCFDDLFADTPNQPYAADKPANEGTGRSRKANHPRMAAYKSRQRTWREIRH
jgi:hypothetical protein